MVNPDRLTAIGLPLRASGWVPDQPGPAAPVASRLDPADVVAVAAPGSRLDALRLGVAARLPVSVATRVEQLSNRAFAVLLAAVLGLGAVTAMKLRAHHAAGYGGEYSATSYDDSSAAAAPAEAGADGGSIVVDVGGKVRHPGLVTLPLGARVADAIRAAGGPLRHRELSHIDLAARVADGQLLMVGARSSAAGAAADSPAPVSLSTASLDELETLPGVGPVTAQKIVDWRTAHGGFTSVSQLQQVSGIGPARYSQLSPLVTP